MAWICAGKTKGAYRSVMAEILVWLGGKVVVLEEGLEMDGDELDEVDEFGGIGS